MVFSATWRACRVKCVSVTTSCGGDVKVAVVQRATGCLLKVRASTRTRCVPDNVKCGDDTCTYTYTCTSTYTYTYTHTLAPTSPNPEPEPEPRYTRACTCAFACACACACGREGGEGRRVGVGGSVGVWVGGWVGWCVCVCCVCCVVSLCW